MLLRISMQSSQALAMMQSVGNEKDLKLSFDMAEYDSKKFLFNLNIVTMI